MGNIVGNNPKKWSSNQVKIREQQLGLEIKTPEALAWSTNNTAWIRAISAVQVDDLKSKELTGSTNYSLGKLAKEFMLFSGTSALKQRKEGDDIIYRTLQKSGVLNTSWDALNNINSSAYGFAGSAERGLVPMPGIISLDINTYNRGSLRNASLKIKAYNREQFAILDALFMRPGYSLLIEWGHTMYFTGSPASPNYQLANFNTKAFQELNKFLEGMGNVDQGSTSILKAITRERGNGSNEEFDDTIENGTQGNYDGFYGKITNFVWGLNNDGSYDIEVKAISIGDVIESLTINNVAEPANIVNTPKKPDPSTNNNSPYPFSLQDDSGQYNRSVTSGTEKQYREWWANEYKLVDLLGQGGNPDGYFDNLTSQSPAVQTEYKSFLTRFPDKMKTFTLKRLPGFNEAEAPLEDDVLITSKDKTLFNRFLFDQYNWLKTNIQKEGKDVVTTNGSTTSIKTLNTYGKDSIYSNLIMVQPRTIVNRIDGGSNNAVGTATILSQNAPYQYIKLQTVLEFIQDKLLMHVSDEKNQNPSPYITFDTGGQNYMYTQPGQLSTNPNVCVIPFVFPKELKEGTSTTTDNTFPNTVLEDSTKTYWEDVLKGVNFKVDDSHYVANLLSIPVNIHYIAKTLQQSTSNNAVKLLPFLESIMYGIQEALGSLNQFSVTYDHDSNQIVIRDDVPLDPSIATETVKTKDDRTFFNVTGYKKIDTRTDKPSSSFITNVGISTTLSNAFATMISIGAQSQSQSDIANSTSLSKFNVGLRDSVAPSKISKAVASKEIDASKDPVVIFTKTITNLNKKESLLSYFYRDGNVPSGELVTASQSQISAFNRYVSTINLFQQGGSQIPSSQGFIPFSMNLDMMGFSGLRIYEKFYISSEILPHSYPTTMSFLVKGLSHSVDGSGWKTKIDSLTITNVDNQPTSPPLIRDFTVTQDPASDTDSTSEDDELPYLTGFIKDREGLELISYQDSSGTDEYGTWRIGYGTDTITYADGKVASVKPSYRYTDNVNGRLPKINLPLTKYNQITLADAERDLDRRLKDNFRPSAIKHLQNNGVDYWDLPKRVKVAFVSIIYNYGSIYSEFALAYKKDGIDGLIAVEERRIKVPGNTPGRRQAEIDLLNSNYKFRNSKYEVTL